MIKLDFLKRTASVLFISGLILLVDCANFKPSSPTADIIYPAAPFLTRRAGVGNETDKGWLISKGFFLKFRYSQKAKFLKKSPDFLALVVRSVKKLKDFVKILWPSQNI